MDCELWWESLVYSDSRRASRILRSILRLKVKIRIRAPQHAERNYSSVCSFSAVCLDAPSRTVRGVPFLVRGPRIKKDACFVRVSRMRFLQLLKLLLAIGILLTQLRDHFRSELLALALFLAAASAVDDVAIFLNLMMVMLCCDLVGFEAGVRLRRCSIARCTSNAIGKMTFFVKSDTSNSM